MEHCGPVASTAQRLLGEESEVLSARERVSIVALASAYRRLVVHAPGRPDTQSEKGLEACGRFLKALENAAHTLELEPFPRGYRESFSANYRALFGSDTRSYRIDILEAGTSLNQHPVIWANGEAYEMSTAAMRCSETLREAWAELCAILDTWVAPTGAPEVTGPLEVSALIAALSSLDEAWAAFERAYISELMKVQERARGLVAQAVESETRLSLLEQSYSASELVEMPAYQAEKRALVACISRLNAVANFQRKGRDDLTVGILDAAVEFLEHCEASAASDSDGPDPALASACHLAEQVVESFEDLRDYFHEVQHHLDLLHPHLCQNSGLVARLVRWEESWEVGARYVHNEEVLCALCYLVPQLQRACRIAPALSEMCEDFDAELFLVLPRIVWLCLLADPAKPIELVRRLLPHRFALRTGAPVATTAGAPPRLSRRHSDPDLLATQEASRTEKGLWMGPELQAVTEKFWRAELLLTRTSSPTGPSAWDLLIRRAVGGAGSSPDPYESLAGGPHLEEARAAAEELMHELEGWSMELQRHSAEDWNECINVLVQCLSGRSRKKEPLGFSL